MTNKHRNLLIEFGTGRVPHHVAKMSIFGGRGRPKDKAPPILASCRIVAHPINIATTRTVVNIPMMVQNKKKAYRELAYHTTNPFLYFLINNK